MLHWGDCRASNSISRVHSPEPQPVWLQTPLAPPTGLEPASSPLEAGRSSIDLRRYGSRDRSCTCILRVMSPTTYCLSTLHGASRETRTRNNCLEGSCVAITPVTHLVRSTGLEPVISGVRSRCLARFGQDRMEPTPGLEPGTSFLPRMCTTRCARKALVGTVRLELT